MKISGKPFRAIILMTGMIICFSFSALSQPLAAWDFEGQVNTPFYTKMYIEAGAAVFGPTLGSIGYVAGNGSTHAYTANNWSLGDIDYDKYIQFELGPEEGYMMTLVSFSFDHRRSGTGVTKWELRSSLDNFTSVLATNTIPDVTSWFTESGMFPAGFSELTAAVTFRIYGFYAEAPTGTWRFDNVYFAGDVDEVPPVPLKNWGVILGIIFIVSLVVISYRRLI